MTVERSKFSSRLSQSEVEEIRSAPFTMRHTDVAKRYGVTPTTVARIRKGVTWPPHTHDVVKVRLPTDMLPTLESAAREQEMATEELASTVVVRWVSRYRPK
jgi:hypothetical protein